MEALRLSDTTDYEIEGPMMAKVKSFDYIVGINDIVDAITFEVPNILPSAIPKLVEDIKTSALMHCCAWLTDGGVSKWKRNPRYTNVNELNSNIFDMANRFFYNNPWQINTSHPMPTNWAIDINDWARATAVFSYQLAETLLNCTPDLITVVERFDEPTLFFTPQKIRASGGGAFFSFTIAIFNRELLPSPGQTSWISPAGNF